MENWSKFKTSGSLLQTREGRMITSYPVSCANRTSYVWSPMTTTPAMFGEKKDVSTMITPGYWKKRAAGEWLPDNPFESTIKRVTQIGSSAWRADWTAPMCTPAITAWDRYDGHYAHSLVPANSLIYRATDSSDEGKLISQVVVQCLAKRQEGEANYFESLAELDQVFGMLHSPIANFRQFHERFFVSESYQRLVRLRKINGRSHREVRPFMKVRRKARNSALHLLVELTTSEYLRYRYGLLPIYRDLQEAMKALKKSYDAGSREQTYTSRANGTITGTGVENFSSSDYYLKYKWQLTKDAKFSVRAKFVDSYTKSAWSDLGLNYQNLMSLPWELLRFSFVVDWFANIGDFIYANQPRVGISPRGGSYFTKEAYDNLWAYIGFENLRPPSEVVFSGSLSDGVLLSLERKRRTAIDLTVWRFSGLVIKSNFKLDQWTRAGDAVSLALQAARKVRF